MESIDIGDEKRTKNHHSDSHRLTIDGAAEDVLALALERVNDGFKGGKVNRNQLAIWALRRALGSISEGDVNDIRSIHLDEFSAFDAILRDAKQSGELPAELKAFIQQRFGYDIMPKKKTKKA